jgi:hypothetical protein
MSSPTAGAQIGPDAVLFVCAGLSPFRPYPDTYAAREFVIRSGMPLRTAARRCPEAVFLPSDPPT